MKKDKVNILSKIIGLLYPLIWIISLIVNWLFRDPTKYLPIENLLKLIWVILPIISILIITYSIIIIIKENNKQKRKKYMNYILNIIIPFIITIAIAFLINIIIK